MESPFRPFRHSPGHYADRFARGNHQHAIHLCSNPKDPPVGQLRITGFLAETGGMAGLSVQFNPYDAVRIDLEESIAVDDAWLKTMREQDAIRTSGNTGELQGEHRSSGKTGNTLIRQEVLVNSSLDSG